MSGHLVRVGGQRWLPVLMALAGCAGAWAAGAAEESGREIAADVVGQAGLVGAADVDAETVIDDYTFDHEVPAAQPAALFVETDHPLVYVWGDSVTAQVSIATNTDEFFPPQPFDYVLFFNDPGILDSASTRREVARVLSDIVGRAADGQRVFVYLQGDEEIRQVRSFDIAVDLLDEAAGREWTAKPDRALESMIRTAQDTLPDRRVKYLWLLGRPAGNTAYRFENVAAVLAGLRDSGTEVSLCGFRDALQPRAVNQLIRAYGGSSYYIASPEELADVIGRDFDYYARPALSDVRISVYPLGGNPAATPLRVLTLRSMGPGEHQSLLATVQVPALGVETGAGSAPRELGLYEYGNGGYAGDQRRRDEIVLPVPASLEGRLPVEQPIMLVDYEYVDERDGRLRRGSRVVTVSYTADFEQYAAAVNYGVVRSRTVVRTYALFSDVAALIRYRQFDDAIMQLDAQAEAVRDLLRHFDDPMIAEDLALLQAYKRQMLDLKRNPDRGSIIFEELSGRSR